MEFLPKNPILEFKGNDLEVIRKKYNFDKPGVLADAIDILEEWIQKQTHFVKKDFSRIYLEAIIITSKGSLEKSKSRIDKMCTYKTLLPQYFTDFSGPSEFQQFFDCCVYAPLPKKDNNHNRVIFGKTPGNLFYSGFSLDLFRLTVIIGEYLRVNDYCDGTVFVVDYKNVDILNLIKNLDVMDLRHGMNILIEGLGCNVRGIHFISTSKYVELLVNVLKQVVSAKIANRFFVHKNIESLCETLPQEILPLEYGGKERSLDELDNEWKKLYLSEEHRQYMKKINASCTDESLRQTDIFNETYLGMPGTFRALSVD